MAEVSKIDIDGVQWDIKDKTARESITGLEANVSAIQALLSDVDNFKINVRTREITIQTSTFSQWSMGLEPIPDGYARVFMLPFIHCPTNLPVLAINIAPGSTFDNVYLYNPTSTSGTVTIYLLSVFKKE